MAFNLQFKDQKRIKFFFQNEIIHRLIILQKRINLNSVLNILLLTQNHLKVFGINETNFKDASHFDFINHPFFTEYILFLLHCRKLYVIDGNYHFIF